MWALYLVIFLFIIEILCVSDIFGPFLSERECTQFLEKHLNDYELCSKDILISINLPFIARHKAFLSCWYISGYGRIPRWSPNNKILNKYWKEQLSVQKRSIKTLANL